MTVPALPHISLLVAAGCALMQLVLTALVIRRRTQAHIHFLDGGDATLLRRMRAHGNFTETAPLALLLLLMLELAGLHNAWLWAFGAALVLSRLLHAWGLMYGRGVFGRVAGTVVGLFSLSGQALACLWLFAR